MDEENRVLTPELEKKLKLFKGFAEESTFLYVPSIYTENSDVIPKKEWPIFKLKGNDGIALSESEDNLGSELRDGKVYTSTGEVRIKILQSNVLGWKNFIDVDDIEIPFIKNGNGLSKESIARMPQTIQVELLQAINNHSKLSKEELEGLEY